MQLYFLSKMLFYLCAVMQEKRKRVPKLETQTGKFSARCHFLYHRGLKNTPGKLKAQWRMLGYEIQTTFGLCFQ